MHKSDSNMTSAVHAAAAFAARVRSSSRLCSLLAYKSAGKEQLLAASMHSAMFGTRLPSGEDTCIFEQCHAAAGGFTAAGCSCVQTPGPHCSNDCTQSCGDELIAVHYCSVKLHTNAAGGCLGWRQDISLQVLHA